MHIALVRSRSAVILVASAALLVGLGACDTHLGRIVGLTGPTGTDTTVVVTVSVSPSTASIGVGATQSFGATPKNANGKVIATAILWSSSSTVVAVVDGFGAATAKAAGTATITALAGTVSGKATLTVTTMSPP
jgi:uncharacterized protein YjdB